MDPIIVSLASNTMTILMPYVTAGAEEFTRAAGQAAFNKAKDLLNFLKTKWDKDEEARDILAHFEEKPTRYQTILEDILKEKLSDDKNLVKELSELLQNAGPVLDIVQNMENSEGITGLKVKEAKKGKVKVTQDIKKSKGVTGAEVDSMG